jgi:hypothetical protein
MLLLQVPGLMHTVTFRRQIFSRCASFDEVYGLLLVWTVPYLLQCAILSLHDMCPYSLPKGLFPQTANSTLRGTVVPMAATLVSSIAAQQRYVISLCNASSTDTTSPERRSCPLRHLDLGPAVHRHERAVIRGLPRGRGPTSHLGGGGAPWQSVWISLEYDPPPPHFVILGLSVWLTTRMLRYLCIFLFVVHTTGVVVFSYCFASISTTIPLALPHIELGLVSFGMVEVFGSVVMMVVKTGRISRKQTRSTREREVLPWSFPASYC